MEEKADQAAKFQLQGAYYIKCAGPSSDLQLDGGMRAANDKSQAQLYTASDVQFAVIRASTG